MEGLLENTDQLKGKMKEKVIENAELGRLSKKLARIFTDCDVQFHEEDFELSMPDGQKVQEIFDELEFRRLKDQFIKLFSGEDDQPQTQVTNSPSAKAAVTVAGAGQFSLFDSDGGQIERTDSRKSLTDTPHVYQSIETGLAKKLFLEKLMLQESVCFDTETTSINPLEAELVGIAFSWDSGKGFYLPFPEDQKEAQKLIEELRPFLRIKQLRRSVRI